MEDMLKVGIITKAHGIRGEVRVFPTTDDPARFSRLSSVLVEAGGGVREAKVLGVKYSKNMVILKLEGIDDANEAERYRGRGLFVTRENAVELGEGEYFIADLIGLSVRSDEGEDLGELSDVLLAAANDVYVVRSRGGGEILIPAIRDCVKKVDLDAGEMVVHLLPGLREANQKG